MKCPICNKSISARSLMCREHWSLVPNRLKRAVKHAHKPGQERKGTASSEYIQAATKATASVIVQVQNTNTPRCAVCGLDYFVKNPAPGQLLEVEKIPPIQAKLGGGYICQECAKEEVKQK